MTSGELAAFSMQAAGGCRRLQANLSEPYDHWQRRRVMSELLKGRADQRLQIMQGS
jgi:hypothetical protein